MIIILTILAICFLRAIYKIYIKDKGDEAIDQVTIMMGYTAMVVIILIYIILIQIIQKSQ